MRVLTNQEKDLALFTTLALLIAITPIIILPNSFYQDYTYHNTIGSTIFSIILLGWVITSIFIMLRISAKLGFYPQQFIKQQNRRIDEQ